MYAELFHFFVAVSLFIGSIIFYFILIKIEIHTKTANSIYNNYGPATDKRFVGRTNARQLKFNVKDKTYLIDITKFKKRTAMALFNGKTKPIIEYNEKKYNFVVKNYFATQHK